MTPTPTPTAARVSGTIMALEWEERTDIDGLHNAESPIGWWFNIRELSGGRAQYDPPPIGGPSSMRSVHPCIEAAKAAAQADYEARILAAIQPDPEPQPVAWAVAVIARKEPQIGYRVRLSSAATEDEAIGESMRVFGELNPGWEIMQPAALPIHTTPSSAGTLSVVRYRLEWLAGARPPAHPEPMKGSEAFGTQEDALAFFSRLADDAKLLSLTRTETVTTRVDLPPALRALANGSEN